MKKVTLDTNCIIDLEDERPAAPYIRKLVELNNRGIISLRLPAISASERRKDKTYSDTFKDFEIKIDKLGLSHLEMLYPPCYFDITYWDCSLLVDDDTLEESIHRILFPAIEFLHSDYCSVRGLDPKSDNDRPWRNAKCDVLAMWSHIHYDGDIFVTSDNNFHIKQKKAALIDFGAKQIDYPRDAAALFAASY